MRLEEFDRAEFGAKIADMNETRQAMREAVVKQFGDAVQLSLIGVSVLDVCKSVLEVGK